MAVTTTNATIKNANLSTWSPTTLFAAGEQGAWYDPSDLNTMFQDSAATTPVTAVEQPVGLIRDKSGRANHASQSTSASRPVLSARYNILSATDTLSTQSVTTVATTYRLYFTGTGSITLSGTATGTYSSGTNTITCTAGTLTLTVSGTVSTADLRVLNDGVALAPYQKVTTSTDYDSNPNLFPYYLKFDGTDDSLATSSIDFSGTDKATVLAGVRKLSDAATGVVVELGNLSTDVGSFDLLAPAAGAGASYYFQSKGVIARAAGSGAFAPAPNTSVLTGIGDIGGNVSTLRQNGNLIQTNTGDQQSGNYSNKSLYIGCRAGSSLPLNGRIYSLIIRGASSTAAQISNAEQWVNGKTKAY